ncbi:Protein arginine N-methyltransferase 8 [Histomonas meleagridis]|uniref:Protein arginine N-methyltransferase 8 n=1 Tax=Histomonas meleagridis TaxID=135588 RepID=UPI003559C37E|nr:Protein arginine N-methyltransferase 8 [Histomonas meleagridis]KAH0805504.1 Protein arginine N-methyltransferase 8 [Histomonas meleagridis]
MAEQTQKTVLYNEDINSNYAQTALHLDMIQDKFRTLTYCQAIEMNKEQFEGKVVLDVGSGSGILSLFAARSGAKKVYSVECTPIGYISETIIKNNHYENIITVLHGRLEEIEVPEKVDIIISEWMGYSLYFEVMLPSVLLARDKYLKPGGALLPSAAQLFITGVQAYEYYATQIEYWDNVYGFDFSAMKGQAFTEPVVDQCEKWQLITNFSTISEINLHDCKTDASFFVSPFTLNVKQNETLHAFVTYFDVFFNDLPVKKTLSTSPMKKQTHWKQTFFYLKKPLECHKGDVVHGTIEFKPNEKDDSGLYITIKYKLNDGEEFSQDYDFF